MKIFAVDTSSDAASAALMDDNVLRGEYILNHKKTHSQKLMPIIDEVFKSCELTPDDIDIYAVTTGPGSFTGLRIGISTVKALAHAAEKPVIGVSTLEALAYNMPCCRYTLCAMLDARNQNVYNAVYKWRGMQVDVIKEPEAGHISECIDRIRDQDDRIMFIGNGIKANRAVIEAELADKSLFAPTAYTEVSAGAVAQAAYFKASDEKNIKSCIDILPVYLRKPQAEREYEERNGKE